GIVGNPRDYVNGNQAFDNVVSQLLEQSRGTNLPPPASLDIIKNLPKIQVCSNNAYPDECAVCKDEYKQYDMVTTLPCLHIYHFPCIESWLLRNGTCPIW
ncbi:hypothetical protein K502DRAFT_296918, partial [Neoconidiobolus thromboides FSU 785]